MTDFSPLLRAHENDSSISWRMQFQSLKIGLEEEGEPKQTLTVGPKKISLCDGLDDPVDLSFCAKQNAWTEYSKSAPRPGWQSLASMLETSKIDLKGD